VVVCAAVFIDVLRLAQRVVCGQGIDLRQVVACWPLPSSSFTLPSLSYVALHRTPAVTVFGLTVWIPFSSGPTFFLSPYPSSSTSELTSQRVFQLYPILETQRPEGTAGLSPAYGDEVKNVALGNLTYTSPLHTGRNVEVQGELQKPVRCPSFGASNAALSICSRILLQAA